jgi:hypothetical protein
MNSALLYLIEQPVSTENTVLTRILSDSSPSRLYLASVIVPGSLTPVESSIASENEYARLLPKNVSTVLMHDYCNDSETTAWDALNWFFSCEEEGVIFVGHLPPEKSFFEFCDWALSAYRKNDKIWHIGTFTNAPASDFGNDSSVCFTNLPETHCWATWRDRWEIMRTNPFYLADECKSQQRGWVVPEAVKAPIVRQLSVHFKHLPDWRPFWSAVILSRQGLCAIHRPDKARWLEPTADAEGDVLTEEASSLPAPQLNEKLSSWAWKKTLPREGLRSAIERRFGEITCDIKRVADNMVSRLLFTGITPIIVASPGRSGSTVLFEAIAESIILKRFSRNRLSKAGRHLYSRVKIFLPRLAGISQFPAPVIKTHDLPSPYIPREAKVIFIYNDPIESARSVEIMVARKGKRWLENHQYNLRAFGRIEDLYKTDILNYEAQLKQWSSFTHPKIIFIHYEDLWSKVDKLSAFLGFPVNLPEKLTKTRKPPLEYCNLELFSHLRAVMRSIREQHQ